MDGVRRVTTVRQLELLVEFAEAHIDLALGRLRSKEARQLAMRLWRECALLLNAEGPARTYKEWAKIWNDTKCRVKTKLTAGNVARRGTGGGPFNNVTLTATEERVANIIGKDVGPISNVRQEQVLEEPAEDLIEEESTGSLSVLLDPNYEDPVPGPSRLSLPPPDTNDEPVPGPSRLSIPPPPPAQTQLLSSSPTPAVQPSSSVSSTPRRRLRRQRPRQMTGTSDRGRSSRVRPAAPTSRDVLDESRAMVLRIEEMRARTDQLIAEAALTQAEAAKAQADACLLQTQAVAAFCQTLSSLMPAVKHYLESKTRTGSAE